MRLIDADALKQEIRKGTRYFVRVWDPKGREKWEMEKDLSQEEIDEIIDNAPTIDAVQVVRCKDCKYYEGAYFYCANERIASPDAYCSAGRKKQIDAEPLVRCKDCKFNYANQIPGGDGCQLCVELPISKDFFCAYGEKMDEEGIK